MPHALFLLVSYFLIFAHCDLLINEVDYDQAGTDTAEFVELYNNGTSAMDISGWVLYLVNGGNGVVYSSTTINQGVVIAAHGYYVLCGQMATVINCDQEQPVATQTNWIQNGPDGVAIRVADIYPNLDSFSYGANITGFFEGAALVGVSDDPNVNDESLGRFPNGISTNNNNNDFKNVLCSTPGYANVAKNGPTCPAPQMMAKTTASTVHTSPATTGATTASRTSAASSGTSAASSGTTNTRTSQGSSQATSLSGTVGTSQTVASGTSSDTVGQTATTVHSQDVIPMATAVGQNANVLVVILVTLIALWV